METIESLEGKKLLITGGTGSFGSTLATNALSSGASEVRIFSRDESKQDYMRRIKKDERLRFFLGDVRNPDGLKEATKGVDYVFHAAALKQVPSCEFFPLEAVATNVQGSANVINAAIENDVQSVVCLSTDKAVYPINAMGMTKGLMEKVALAKSRERMSQETTVSVTRYGNVMFSRGSVIPLFMEQIYNDLPVTVTNSEMTRFLMSLDDSVDLVVHAFENAKPGDIFVRKAPSATLGTLVEAIGVLMKKQPTIKEIGPRHGEKLFETLLSAEELSSSIDSGNYYRLPIDERGLNYENYVEAGHQNLSQTHSYDSHSTALLDVAQVADLLSNQQQFQIELTNLQKA